MMNSILNSKYFHKKEKGQIIVIMALVFIGLIAIVGLAIDLGDMFVAYSRLRRAVDAAALAATSQFREGYDQVNLQRAAQQFLDLNGINITNTDDIVIEACSFAVIPNDPNLCTNPSRKLVRVTVTQQVPLYFMAIVGLNTVPITVDAISEAASVDLVLLIDNSSSMAQDNHGNDANPKDCNPATPGGAGSCHPFEEIKAAAKLLVQHLYLSKNGNPGYDRVSIVTFARFPKLELAMTDNEQTILNTLDNLTVYQGEYKCPFAFDNGIPYSEWLPRWLAEPATPPHTTAGLEGPCRLHYGGTTNPDSGLLNPDGAYLTLYSLRMYASEEQADPDPKDWMVTNSGGGLKVAGKIFQGGTLGYPAGAPSTPDARETALRVVVWLTDGYTNAGYTLDGDQYIQTVANSGVMICPKYTWQPIAGYPDTRWCVDQDARPTVAELFPGPAPLNSMQQRHNSSDILTYDPDDYARDMVDFVTNDKGDPAVTHQISGQSALLFTIGLGTKISQRSHYEIANNLPAPGETLLQYGAWKGSGIYYPAPSASQLDEVFLAIANKIATRLSR